MAYCTEDEVRGMIKDDALNTLIGDAYIEEPEKILNKFAKDIAVYNLFSRIGIDESSEQKNILNRYNAAIKFLTLLAEGKVDIGVSDTTEAARTGFSVSSSPRLFSRDKLRGM